MSFLSPVRRAVRVRLAFTFFPSISFLSRPPTAEAAGAWPLTASASRAPSGGYAETLDTGTVVGRPFRILTVATVVCIFALVSLGGVVRLTDSGLGCPDWPLCHGKVIPPLEKATLIEYSHRMMASLAGILTVATALIVWRSYRSHRGLLIPATIGLALLTGQVLLGGFTVLKELPAELVLAHLATAEALMAAMIVVCVVALLGSGRVGFGQATSKGRDRFLMVALAAALGAYGLLLTGSYVTVSDATSACGQSWPLCNGQLIPDVYLSAMHMLHRVAALVVGALVAGALIMAWQRKSQRRILGSTSATVAALFTAQVLIGAATLWMGFPLAARLLHLMMATLLWTGLVVLAVLAFASPNQSLRSVTRA